MAQDSSPGGSSPVNASGAIELPEVVVEAESGNANTSTMQAFQDKMNAMDQSRDNFLLPKFGATTYNMDYEALEAPARQLHANRQSASSGTRGFL